MCSICERFIVSYTVQSSYRLLRTLSHSIHSEGRSSNCTALFWSHHIILIISQIIAWSGISFHLIWIDLRSLSYHCMVPCLVCVLIKSYYQIDAICIASSRYCNFLISYHLASLNLKSFEYAAPYFIRWPLIRQYQMKIHNKSTMRAEHTVKMSVYCMSFPRQWSEMGTMRWDDDRISRMSTPLILSHLIILFSSNLISNASSQHFTSKVSPSVPVKKVLIVVSSSATGAICQPYVMHTHTHTFTRSSQYTGSEERSPTYSQPATYEPILKHQFKGTTSWNNWTHKCSFNIMCLLKFIYIALSHRTVSKGFTCPQLSDMNGIPWS